ncbi:MAG: hypothetical protein GX864_02530 [Mollicutes bacterium]|jgi:aminobenzoyl-glutamate transport protein|nr:hypothetical protein [Mollicutes bacterium]
MSRLKFKERVKLHPIMSFIILIVLTIIVSGILGYFDIGANYLDVNPKTQTIETSEVFVDSLFNLAGLKYIFSNTVSNFVSFAPLSMLIIILVGIGIMDKSGFLQAFFTLITKFTKKTKVTFFLILTSILASLCGEVVCVIMIPIGALLFKYGKRNPMIGIIASYAGVTCGIASKVVLSSIDSTLITYSKISAQGLDPNYTINTFGFVIITLASIIILSFALTAITERFVVPRLEKYTVEEEIEDYTVGRRELRGIIIALAAGILYMLFFTYNIIPGLPLSGSLLDHKQTLYIDKLFGYNTFFSLGFIFVVTMLFIILGLFYGLGTKTIKSNKMFSDYLSFSLDKIGKVLVLILFASTFIGVFKRTYLGNVISASLVNVLLDTKLSGFVLVLVMFVISIISAFFLPGTVLRWSIMGGTAVRSFMNAGLSAEFAQIIFRAGEAVALGLTPLFAYFIIYLGYIKQYNHSEKPITISQGIKYIIPYSVVTAVIWLVLIVIWYTIGIPLGINTTPFL